MTTLADWVHAGFRCRVLANGDLRGLDVGVGNGYVGIPRSHPMFGQEYDHLDLDVHGGLTFGEPGGESENWPDAGLWWFGFDTCHYGDTHEKWGLEDVVAETEHLAEQLEAATPPPAARPPEGA